jgi:hypothetical protein
MITTGAASATPVVMCGIAFDMNTDSSRSGQMARFAPPERLASAGGKIKIPLLSNTLNRFVRKRWNYSQNFAFLLDSQAKFP